MKANPGTKIVLLFLTAHRAGFVVGMEARPHMRGARLLRLSFLLAFLLALPVPFFAQAADNTLTNGDVVRMMKAGVPESIILREIQTSRTDFGTGPDALIKLKNQGASERVLGAVLDSRMGTSSSQSEPLPGGRVPAQSTAQGPHHLPTFEADMKFNSKVNGKLFVGKDHIKLVRAGVPLFSVKWKETTPKGNK